MFWQEESNKQQNVIPDTVIDLVFDIQCKTLPIDHAYELSQAILNHLPWLAEEEGSGIHQIHVAESGNGWMRPEEPNEVLYLSRRTKLSIRLPKARMSDAETLVGQTIDIAGHSLSLGKASIKSLSELGTLFSRYVVTEEDESENDFLMRIAEQMKSLDVQVKKMMAGRSSRIQTPNKTLNTRSIMLADLNRDEAFALQEKGIGDAQLLGCGLFIPHKGITAVKAEDGKSQG